MMTNRIDSWEQPIMGNGLNMVNNFRLINHSILLPHALTRSLISLRSFLVFALLFLSL